MSQNLLLQLSVAKSSEMENRIRNGIAEAIGQVCGIEDAPDAGRNYYRVSLTREADREAVKRALRKIEGVNKLFSE